MWLVAINPSSGHGKGATYANRVLKFLSLSGKRYQVFSASNAHQLRSEVESALDFQEFEGVISVGGDGLAHLLLQLVVPRSIPIATYLSSAFRNAIVVMSPGCQSSPP